MKKYNFINMLALCTAISCNLNNAFSQSTSSGPGFINTPSGAGDYLGWTGGTNRSVDIKNSDAYPIDFYTNGNPRMEIRSNGNIGIGNFTGFTPIERLHLREASSNPTTFLMTGNNTGDDADDGFRISLTNSSTATDQSVELNLFENSRMNFLTNNTQRMQIAGGGNVGIGDVAQSTGKLYVKNDYATSSALSAIDVLSTNSSGSNRGVSVNATGNASSPNSSSGLYSISNTAYFNYGIFSQANHGRDNYGGYLYSNGGTNTVTSTGVNGIGESGTTAYGGFFYASGASTNNIGVYAEATGTGAVAGQFNGDVTASGNVTVTGDVTANAFIPTSDSILKTNVTPLTNGLAIINLLQPKTYDFRITDYPSMHLLEGNHAGLIAQDLEQVLPGLVFALTQRPIYDNQGNVVIDSINYKGVNYIELIPYLISAIKEQQSQIQTLQLNQNQASPSPSSQKEVKLVEKSIVVLEQNQPNPFRDKTSINYNIPEDANSAQILFYNSKGNVISTVEITEKGAGSLLVYGADLTNGVYTYTLLVNDKVIETKKMMKVK